MKLNKFNHPRLKKEGHVYRRYTCKGCGRICIEEWYEKNELFKQSQTSAIYKCPTCFPNDVDWWGE